MKFLIAYMVHAIAPKIVARNTTTENFHSKVTRNGQTLKSGI